jgi:hypothetical protein
MENSALTPEQSEARHQRSIALSLENGMSVSLAYHIAEKIVDKKYPDPLPPGTFVDDFNMVRQVRTRPEPPSGPALATLGGVKKLQHREVVHTFADRTTWVACCATDCYAGKINPLTGTFRKRHSDGSPLGTYPTLLQSDPEPAEPEIESEVQELDMSRLTSGGDEINAEDEVETTVEGAATEGGEDEDEYADE